MLVRVNAARDLVVALACVLPAVFAAGAHAQGSDCPECDQYQLVIPDPRGGGGTEGGSPGSPGGGSQAPPSASDGEGSSSGGSAESGARDRSPSAEIRAARTEAKKSSERAKRKKDKKRSKDRDEPGSAVTAGPDQAITNVAQQDLDYEQRPAASAALAQLANPLTILLAVAMGASLWLSSRRRDRAGGQ